MKTTLLVISLLLMLLLALFFVRGLMSRTGSAPGLVGGQLTVCSDKPNCVCSETGLKSDAYIAPISLSGSDLARARDVLRVVIIDSGGKIASEENNYIAATFASAVFHFVDDVEFRLDASQAVIHVRSASRVGHSDFGVNRKRVESLKKQYLEKLSS